jgi:hypothetical protein
MSKISFENFGHLAEKAEDNTIIASRYLIQKEAENINYLPGNFLDIEIRQSFKKIFFYSVLHYFSNIDQVLLAVNKAAGLLENNGILLLGDIPNTDSLKRFISTPQGEKEYNEFSAQTSSNPIDKNRVKFYLQGRKLDSNCLEFNDTVVEKIKSTMISNGYSVKVVRQDPKLPFGSYGQDIIIKNTNN